MSLLKNPEQWLKRRGYMLNETEKVGFWVDGACGFLVAGYFKTKYEAMKISIERIKEAQRLNQWPIWRIK